MVATGFGSGQQTSVIPFSLHASFFGWFCLLFALAYSGFALDFWEGEPMAHAARFLQHGIFVGASFIALTRFHSFVRRKPLERMVEALQGLSPGALAVGSRQGVSPWFKGLKFWALFLSASGGLMACFLPVDKRITLLAVFDGVWYVLALNWLSAQYRFGRARSKEKVKEALDDLRSLRRPESLPPLDLMPDLSWWAKSLVLLGSLAITGISALRLSTESEHVMQAQLQQCLEGMMARENFRGRWESKSEFCPQLLISRFDLRADGIGPNRRTLAQEKAGLDPLGDNLPGNQIWSLSAQGVLRRQR